MDISFRGQAATRTGRIPKIVIAFWHVRLRDRDTFEAGKQGHSRKRWISVSGTSPQRGQVGSHSPPHARSRDR
eukprot:5976491-Pyramimonas_sp.AAC.1